MDEEKDDRVRSSSEYREDTNGSSPSPTDVRGNGGGGEPPILRTSEDTTPTDQVSPWSL